MGRHLSRPRLVHDYLFPIEVVRFAFVAGVVVSMLLYERRHLTTGSIVVPGYVAVFLLLPSVIVATMLNAALSYLLVNKVLMRWFLLYGRAKFTILAIISISVQTLMLKVSPSGPWLWEADVPLCVGVGYVVPALIAHDMGRQGIAKTAKSVMLASVIVGMPILLAAALHLPEVTSLAPFQPISQSHLAAGWIPLAILLSAVAAWAVARNYGLRSGGFVGAALVAVFAVNVWQVLFVAAVAIGTNLIVTRVLMTRLILFGRRKFASMLMLSSAIVWITVWTGQQIFPFALQEHLGVSSLALTPLFLPGLLANDMQRASIARVLAGASVASIFVLSTTWTIQSLVTRDPQPAVRTVVAAVATCVVFGPQLRTGARLFVTDLRTFPRRIWGHLLPPLEEPSAAAPLAAVVAPHLTPGTGRPSTPHAARPLGHRGPVPSPANRSEWLAGRRQAAALAPPLPPKHLAGPSALAYRPRHLASGTVHRFPSDERSSARASLGIEATTGTPR